jgi:hypothetical protein
MFGNYLVVFAFAFRLRVAHDVGIRFFSPAMSASFIAEFYMKHQTVLHIS